MVGSSMPSAAIRLRWTAVSRLTPNTVLSSAQNKMPQTSHIEKVLKSTYVDTYLLSLPTQIYYKVSQTDANQCYLYNNA